MKHRGHADAETGKSDTDDDGEAHVQRFTSNED